MNMSFFARPSFIGASGDDTTVYRLSSRIRAEQISRYLGAKLNPKEGYENDFCIYVKPRGLNVVPENAWMDFADGDYLLDQLKSRPDIKIIAAAEYGYEYLKSRFPNKIVLIPQQHVNWENIKRNRNKVATGGYIGGLSTVSFNLYKDIESRLNKVGLNFITCYNFKTRQDAINFYMSVDFLVISRFRTERIGYPFTTPTKMINAAAFGVPSIASWKDGYLEFEGCYTRADNLDDMMIEVEKFRNETYYNQLSEKAIKDAEKYHISKIADKYRRLCDEEQ
jgi:hypothetical protein